VISVYHLTILVKLCRSVLTGNQNPNTSLTFLKKIVGTCIGILYKGRVIHLPIAYMSTSLYIYIYVYIYIYTYIAWIYNVSKLIFIYKHWTHATYMSWNASINTAKIKLHWEISSFVIYGPAVKLAPHSPWGAVRWYILTPLFILHKNCFIIVLSTLST
jgi:hypothetical protein